MKNDKLKCSNYFLPFRVKTLEAKILAISISSSNNHFDSLWSPLFVSLNKVSQTLVIYGS